MCLIVTPRLVLLSSPSWLKTLLAARVVAELIVAKTVVLICSRNRGGAVELVE
jgi:hypothetical protein